MFRYSPAPATWRPCRPWHFSCKIAFRCFQHCRCVAIVAIVPIVAFYMFGYGLSPRSPRVHSHNGGGTCHRRKGGDHGDRCTLASHRCAVAAVALGGGQPPRLRAVPQRLHHLQPKENYVELTGQQDLRLFGPRCEPPRAHAPGA
eukprot:gene8137-biopygen21123